MMVSYIPVLGSISLLYSSHWSLVFECVDPLVCHIQSVDPLVYMLQAEHFETELRKAQRRVQNLDTENKRLKMEVRWNIIVL